MKNAGKHAEELKSLLKKLTKDGKAPPRTPMDPMRALVRACFSFDTLDTKADEVLAVFDKEFVDLNELRVATDLEIIEFVGNRVPDAERRVTMCTQALNYIFEREHTLTLERIKALPKKEIRQFYRDLPDPHPFVDAYVMLYGYEGSAVPLDEETRRYLIDNDVLADDAPLDEAQKFIENHLKAEECYEFFHAVRKAVIERIKRRK